MKTIIDSNVWNALRANTAPRDVRYYLAGIYIDTENHSAVATDGHSLFRVDIEMIGMPHDDIAATGEDCQPFIIDISSHPKAPKGGTVEIDTLEFNGIGAVVYKARNGTQKAAMALEKIDGMFPDYRKVIPDREKCSPEFSQIVFNPELIQRTTKELGAQGVKLTSEGSNGDQALLVQIQNMLFHDLVVMPMRW